MTDPLTFQKTFSLPLARSFDQVWYLFSFTISQYTCIMINDRL